MGPEIKGNPLHISVYLLIASYFIGEFIIPKYPLIYLFNLSGLVLIIISTIIFFSSINSFSAHHENPLPKTVHFVKAELSSHDVLQRACVNRASGIIVHGHDDNESLVIALAVRSANSKAHIVVQLDKEESELHIKRIDPYIECVTPLSIPLIVQAVQDRGATLVIKALLSNITDDTIFRLDIPFNNQNWDFKTLQRFFKDQLESTLIAVTTSSSPQAPIKVNPPSNFLVASGTSVFYIGPRRLTPKAIKWENIQAKANID